MKKLAIFSIVLFAFLSSIHAQVVENKPPRDNFYDKVNSVGKKPRPYVGIREADVFYTKRIWRMIDFREKFNQHFYYPTRPVQDRVSFMHMVMTGLKEGKIHAYDDFTDDFTKPLTYEEFMASKTNITEREVEDLDNPGQMLTQSDTTTFSTEDVKLLRVKEDWFIDRQRSMRDIRVGGLAPVLLVYDDQTGDFRGYETMFWIHYDECRDLFVNTEAFNRHNSAMRMSFDDVFAWKRFFNSYIYKADNAQDRQIQDYLQSWQVMAESEKIKNDLLNYEEDLWEY